MKMVVAVIKPFKLDEVRDALTEVGVEGMTVVEVRGYGRQKGRSDDGKGSDHGVSYLPKLKLEIAVPDELVAKSVKAIQKAANTGRIGDGKIFVYDLLQAVRIRTGEQNEDAL